MSQNGIAWLPTKEARQIAKLNLAAAKRGESYDIDLLPTKYSGNNVVNNPNVGGLQKHRPWVSGGMVEGAIWRNVYSGYISSSMPDPNNLISSGAVDTMWESIPENTTYEYVGYIRSNYSGMWTFNVNVDDMAWFWIGPKSQAATLDNAQIKLNAVGAGTTSILLQEGGVYPFRLLCANAGSVGYVEFNWWNDLVLARVVSLDAAVNPTSLLTFDTTDEFTSANSATLIQPGIEKVTTNGGIINFAGQDLSSIHDGYAVLANDFQVDFSSGITISIWANVATGSGNWSRLIDFGNGSANNNIIVGLSGAHPGYFFFELWDSGNSLTTPLPLSPIDYDQWNLYTLTGDGSNWYWYVNDTLEAQHNTSALPTTVNRNASNCRIGGSNWDGFGGNDPTLKGSIATLEMYTRALSIDEITGLFNERKGRFGL